jgi:hypothetical protein
MVNRPDTNRDLSVNIIIVNRLGYLGLLDVQVVGLSSLNSPKISGVMCHHIEDITPFQQRHKKKLGRSYVTASKDLGRVLVNWALPSLVVQLG